MFDAMALAWAIIWLLVGIGGLGLIWWGTVVTFLFGMSEESPGIAFGGLAGGIILWLGWLILSIVQFSMHISTLINGG